MGNLYLPFTQTCMVAMILWQAVYLVVMVYRIIGSRCLIGRTSVINYPVSAYDLYLFIHPQQGDVSRCSGPV